MVDKFDDKINLDTDTEAQINEKNEKLVQYLNDTGEHIAAGSVQSLINNQETDEAPSKKGAPLNKQILATDRRILEVLEKIYADMHDEQDTSIKKASKVPTPISSTGRGKAKTSGKSAGAMGGGLLSVLGGLLGAAGAASLLKRPKATKVPDSKKPPAKKPPAKKTPAKKPKSKKPPARRPQRPIKPNKPNVPKVSTKTLANLGKGVLRMGKFVPGLGLVLAGGMAIYDGVQGWDEASGNLGIAEEDLTTTNKAASAAGAIFSGVTFGLAGEEGTAQGINNLFGGNDAIEKYGEDGLDIIDYDSIWGDSEVNDWDKLAALKAEEIQKIIDIDDWSAADKQRMEALKSMVELSNVQAPTSTAKAITPETEFSQVNYKMKNIPSLGIPQTGTAPSDNPGDYKVTKLFRMNGVDQEHFDGLNPAVQHNLKAMGAEYYDMFGKQMQINSAYRSFEEQQAMKDKYGAKAAAAGSSMHNYGLAVDMNTVDTEKAISVGLFKKYGFTRPVPGETWHVEPAGIDRAGIRAAGMADPTIAEKYTHGVGSSSLKTSGLPTETEGLETETTSAEINAVDPDVNKSAREVEADQSSDALSTQTSMYDRGTRADIHHTSINPIMEQNINNTNRNVDGEDRILNHFSQ